MPVSPRRKYFHAQAIGFGGIIGKIESRPADILIDIMGASALSTAGGRHKNEVTRRDIPEDQLKWVDFDRIITRTEGRFTDPGAVFQISENEHKSQDESEFQTATMSEVVVENLCVLGIFRAAEISARVVAQTPRLDEDSPIFIDVPTFKEVTIRGAKVDITVDHNILGASTLDRLSEAFKEKPDQFFHPKSDHKLGFLEDLFKDGPHKNHDGAVKFTFVSAVSGGGKTHRDQPNRLEVEDFGHIHFGEVLARKHSRRVSMLRFALGSDEGGNFESCSLETNGSWSP